MIEKDCVKVLFLTCIRRLAKLSLFDYLIGNFLGVEITDSSSIFLIVLPSFHNDFRLILLLVLFKTNIAEFSSRLDICDRVILHILTVLYGKVSLDAETFRSQSLRLWVLIKPLVNEIHAELRLILLVYVVLLL